MYNIRKLCFSKEPFLLYYSDRRASLVKHSDHQGHSGVDPVFRSTGQDASNKLNKTADCHGVLSGSGRFRDTYSPELLVIGNITSKISLNQYQQGKNMPTLQGHNWNGFIPTIMKTSDDDKYFLTYMSCSFTFPLKFLQNTKFI